MATPDIGRELQFTQPPRKDSPLPDIQAYLGREAKGAFREPTFLARNNRMGKAVGKESSILAARSIGRPEISETLEAVFTAGSKAAGERFRNAFNEFGSPPDKPVEGRPEEAVYKKALVYAKVDAYTHLPALFEAAGLELDNVEELVKSIDFNDSLAISARVLGLDLTPDLTPEKIRASLHTSMAGDYYEKLVDKLQFADSDKTPRNQDERNAIDLAVRMANATWKTGQVHKSAWQGSDKFIDPEQSEDFNPYETFLRKIYERFEQRSPEDALIAAAFGVYKDIDNLHRSIELSKS